MSRGKTFWSGELEGRLPDCVEDLRLLTLSVGLCTLYIVISIRSIVA